MELTSFTDYPARRARLFNSVQEAVTTAFPIQNDRYTIQLDDVQYKGPERYSLSDQKKAILGGKSLTRKLAGRWTVTDNATGSVVSKSPARTVMNVPYLTNRGTYIRNGTEYSVSNQFRLLPSVYTRRTDDGKLESQFNVKARTGSPFRVFMEPRTSVFYMRYRGRKVPLYPLLHAMGVEDEALESTWGKDIVKTNRQYLNSPHAARFIKSLTEDKQLQKTAAYGPDVRDKLHGIFNRMELDEDATEATLGRRHRNVTSDTLLDSTRKILRMSRQEAEGDDRDSLEYQTIHGTADFLADKVRQDQQGLARKLLWKVTHHNGAQDRIPASFMDKHVDHLFNLSGLSQVVEEINPMELYDQNQRVVRLGEGGISSVQAVPKEARNVQPSYLNFVDPVRAPESMKIGVDMKLAKNVKFGTDGQLYTEFRNLQTGKPEWLSQRQASRSVVAFPGGMKGKSKYVPAMVKSKGIFYVPREEVQYEVPRGDHMFSDGANLVPLKSGVKAMRLLMGSKMANQALPLHRREAPFVQTLGNKDSIEKELGESMGARRAKRGGVVKAVRKDRIDLVYDDGSEDQLDLYKDFPFARKTFINTQPVVEAGQKFKPGELLTTSNFTDDKGTTSLGTNLRVAYMTYQGKNFEDAVVISQSAADKLSSEHMYNEKMELDEDTTAGRNAFRANFPGKFDKKQLKNIRDDGTVKPGTTVNYGDPLVLAVKRRGPTSGSLGRSTLRDESVIWKHHSPGLVTDVAKTKNGYAVYVKASSPSGIGDKLAGRYGNKGTISDIVPDEDMPKNANGQPFDILLHPLGIITRTNSAQMIEAALGKIAEKTGKPYVLPGFMDEDMVEYAQNELRKNQLEDKEELTDPKSGKSIPGVLTGNAYFYKLQHMAESKGKARSVAGYTMDEKPSRGGPEGAKHLGDMEIQALLAHGADKVLKDLKLIKGQKNDQFWRQLKLGQTPTMPGTPLVYNKFKDMIRASGVNLREDKSGDHIFAMTRHQAEKLTGAREIKNSGTFGSTSMRPVEGGLFDPNATGSLGDGSRWSYIKLPEPMVNPVMEEPIRTILGMTQKEFDEVLFGGKAFGGKHGGEAVKAMLQKINLPTAKQIALEEIKHGAKSKRQKAVKQFQYLSAMEKNGVKPEDFLMDRIPVLPPKYRPITRNSDMTIVADPNYLYKALIESSNDMKESQGLPQVFRNQAREAMVKNYRALIGVADPVQAKLQQKKVSGIMSQLFGKGSPKAGFVQRRVIGADFDVSGLAVVTPNPSLKLNQVGLPESKAWELYEPFIIRHLVQRGVPATAAAKAVAEKKPNAYAALQDVIKDRPVIMNRAPTLHKYSMIAAWPVLTKGETLQVSPTIVKPMGMDFDGDTASYSVPVSREAVEEAIQKMLPEKNLISARNDRPTYMPSNEYIQGLWLATKRPANKKPKRFPDRAAAKAAYKAGAIRIDDPILITGD